MNKKKSGEGGHICSAPFFLSKSAVKIFLNSLDNVLHPERGVKMSFLHNLEEKIKVDFFSGGGNLPPEPVLKAIVPTIPYSWMPQNFKTGQNRPKRA